MSIIKKLRELKFLLTRTSYSQAGEDSVVRFLFSDIGLKNISYLDLGTNNPKYGNNTYWFYLNNSNGVCVEADFTLYKKIKKIRAKDKVIHAGVSISDEEKAIFYIFDEPAINTFDKEQANNRVISGKYKILKEVEVDLININALISQNFQTYPEFISIDIEGLDLDVLKSLDFNKFPVPVFCIETCEYSETHIRPKNNTIIDFMISKGYFIYADTYINTIFVNKKWFNKS
jgi:FkbM family methyltransferase